MMELPVSQEEEMPIPLNSTFGGHGHMIHNNHIIIPSDEHNVSNNFKKIVKYKECLKNHAASMGGNATDGCGEFMPSGEEGTLEALNCSACNCHRNFHRKEIDGEPSYDISSLNPRIGRRVFLGNHNYKGYFGHDGLISSRPIAPHQMIMSYNNNMGPSESDEQEEGGVVVSMVRPSTQMMMMKKRFRTKFSQEQKEKMMNFAEKVGWKIQKQEEGVVQQFCQEIGVKRRVLKVWMHNNKHTLAKKSIVDHQDNVAQKPNLETIN